MCLYIFVSLLAIELAIELPIGLLSLFILFNPLRDLVALLEWLFFVVAAIWRLAYALATILRASEAVLAVRRVRPRHPLTLIGNPISNPIGNPIGNSIPNRKKHVYTQTYRNV